MQDTKVTLQSNLTGIEEPEATAIENHVARNSPGFLNATSAVVENILGRYSSKLTSVKESDAISEEEWEILDRVNIGSIDIDQYSQTALIDEILHHALCGDTTRQVVTANAQFYVLAQKSRRFRNCLSNAEYICADGMPIVWACNSLYGRHVPRIAGVNLIEKICQYGAAHRLRVFLLGGREGAGDRTAEILKSRYPGIRIAGVSCPPLGFEKRDDSLEAVLNEITAAKAHILFVGLGAPKQELFIDNHVRATRVPLAIGIGGSFELLSGRLQRAPQWMQSCGLEWVFRLSQEPARLWRRYLIGNAEFIWHIGRAKLASITQRETASIEWSPEQPNL
jgi:N-acetylglucosaminyldiphosphoundecaprenol N-acetyl-beta-D-mannosaminyltransferase